MAVPSAAELDAHFASNSYYGSSISATLEDYKLVKTISAADAQKHPHLNRWHAHVTELAAKYPEYDWRGEKVPAGKAPPALSSAQHQAAPKKAEPKQDAAPKKEAVPKKEAAPKKEAKGKDAPKDGAKEEKKEGKAEKPEPTPEELRKAKLKKVIKEGGKRGVEIEGAADMGGLQFFCTSVDEPQGDLEMLIESMKAMNAKSDPAEEERKGGSGHIGKVLFSAGTEQLAVCAFVPEEKLTELSCEEWLKFTLEQQSGEILTTSKTLCTGRVKTDADKGIFPLKIRESMIIEANNFLRSKGLFPQDDGDDDDEMVFGDDDFPS